MGRLPHYYETGQYGDGREETAATYLQKHAPSGDPDAALSAFEDFHQYRSLLHLGPEKGRYLDDAVRGRVPSFILEIGTYIGYSAIRMARLLSGDAHLISVEQNPANALLAKQNIAHAGLEDRVTVLCGTLDSCRSMLRMQTADLVFLDHRKAMYLEELQRLEAFGIVRTGTVVVADNVLGLKHLAARDAAIKRGKRKKACNCQRKACNYVNYVRNSGRYESRVFWGLKDGIEVSVATQLPGKMCSIPKQNGMDCSSEKGKSLHKSHSGFHVWDFSKTGLPRLVSHAAAAAALASMSHVRRIPSIKVQRSPTLCKALRPSCIGTNLLGCRLALRPHNAVLNNICRGTLNLMHRP